MDGIHMVKFNMEKIFIILPKLMVVWIMEEVYLIMQLFGFGCQHKDFQEIIELD